jgi:ornithine cyclodeaminase
MKFFTAEQIRAQVSMPAVVESLRAAFQARCVAPPRQVVGVPGGEGDRLLLCMPAFDSEGGGMVKLATVFPDNPANAVPTIQAAIVVFSKTGTPLALLDGGIVTKLRTGAASALASTYLSRTESKHLVIIGTGALAPFMAWAHCAVRPIERITIVGRLQQRAAVTSAAVRSLVDPNIEILVTQSAESAVATADIVSCATSSTAPVLAGNWLSPGAFVDLVGSFSPSKREADDDVVLRSRIFVDTLEGALSEAGDVLEPMNRGIIGRARIEGELADLVSGRAAGRRRADEIIMFKSVGTAIEDLAAARLIIAAGTGAPAQDVASASGSSAHG